MSTHKKIIIVGGGLAGLSAGIYAQLNGYHAEIFEQHTLPGGVCTCWKRESYTIDGCIHWLMGTTQGSFLRKIYEEVGVFNAGLKLLPVNHFGTYSWLTPQGASEHSIEITHDLEQIEKNWLKLSPQDAPLLQKLIQGIRAFHSYNADWGTPPEVSSIWKKLSVFWQMRKQFMYFGHYSKSVRDFCKNIQHPFLKWHLENLFLPEMPTFFLMMILGELTSGKLGVFEEGSLKFSLAIAKRFQQLGGTLHFKSDVSRILVKDHRAIGIELKDGAKHFSDTVISAADLHSTLYKLLENQYTDPDSEQRFEQWPLFDPILILSFGVKKEFKNLPTSHLFRLSHSIDTGGRQENELFVKFFNEHPSFAPPQNTTVQAIIRTDYDYWEKLQKNRIAYDQEKIRIANAILQELNTLHPGFSSQVEMIDVATPMTFVYFTRNYRGAWEGWNMTPEAFRTRIPRTLPRLENFYLAGQWVEPGGGVPTALLSGRTVIQILCKKDRKKFTASDSQSL